MAPGSTPSAPPTPAAVRHFHFVGSNTGAWQVTQQTTVCGESLPLVSHISVLDGPAQTQPSGAGLWTLSGITSNERYVTRAEKTALVAKQEGLGRSAATMAAIIPIRKSAAWWALMQDERRAIVEDQSQHIAIGMKYLPAIARRLHHCRDLGVAQPFDFVTWFEYAPADSAAFDDLVAALRATPEWAYVDREVDIRLVCSS